MVKVIGKWIMAIGVLFVVLLMGCGLFTLMWNLVTKTIFKAETSCFRY